MDWNVRCSQKWTWIVGLIIVLNIILFYTLYHVRKTDLRFVLSPAYTPHYLEHRMDPSENELSVCTNNDSVLENSEPQLSSGCRGRKFHPGITLVCQLPIPIRCNRTLSMTREVFFQNLQRTSVKCSIISAIGNPQRDGVWRLCGVEPFLLEKRSCLVYSFGIDNEWSFDDAISKHHECEVHSFDPTMNIQDHQRDERITFHNLGVAGHGEKFSEAKRKGWRMMTFKEIFQMLGHTDRIIDILKVDIEYTEWDAFEDALKSNSLQNVKQIAMEFHVWCDHPQAYVRFHRIISALENAGFEKWFVGNKPLGYEALNLETGKLTTYHYQADMGFVNTNFLR